MTTETSTPILDTPAGEQTATKEGDAQPSTQLQSGSETQSEVPAAVESAPACETSHEKEEEKADAPMKDEDSTKTVDSVVSDIAKAEPATVDGDEKPQGINNHESYFTFFRDHADRITVRIAFLLL